MGKNRVEAFSDGVIAIVITLLVLEIRVPAAPPGGLVPALLRMGPKFGTYLVSFLVVAVWWISHHALLEHIRSVDRGILWLNNLFLLALAFIPFPTALVGEYPSEPAAVALYGVVGMVTGAAFVGMRAYACSHPHLLTHGEESAERLRAFLGRSLAGPVLYGVAAVAALWAPWHSMVLYAAIALYFSLAGFRKT